MIHTVLRPASLRDGDSVAIVSPSGVIDPVCVESACSYLRSWNLTPRVMPHALGVHGRYAGTEVQRLSDFTDALADPEIKAIWCSRGGYGAVHLLPYLSAEFIANNPKWLIGFSDISVLLALFVRSGVAGLHAPMSRHLYEEGEDEAAKMLRRTLVGEALAFKTPAHPLNRQGEAEAQLVGGNLAVMCGLRGSQYDYAYENRILFIEDIGEKPYQIERMLYNLKLGGVLAHLSGLIVGRFADYEEDCSMEVTLYERIAQLVAEYHYPVCFDFPVGHVKQNYPLVVGGNYALQVSEKGGILKELVE